MSHKYAHRNHCPRDHGKTAGGRHLRKAHFLRDEAVVERVMDSTTWTRNAHHLLPRYGCFFRHQINIVDTPGHTIRRPKWKRAAHVMAGCCCGRQRGPLRKPLRAAKGLGELLRVVLNKIDPRRRPNEVLDEIYDLFIDLERH